MESKYISQNTILDNIDANLSIVLTNQKHDKTITLNKLIMQIKNKYRDIHIKQIGDIYINIDNSQKNKPSFTKGFFEYLYLDGRTLNRVDYPDLALALGYSTDTFTIPNSQGDRYLKNLSISTTRDLMSIEDWKTGKPTGFVVESGGNHKHGMAHQHNIGLGGSNNKNEGSGSTTYDNQGKIGTGGGRDTTDDSGNHSHNSSGWDTQTEVNNLGIQLYIKSKLVGI